jgi:hypothetical protein
MKNSSRFTDGGMIPRQTGRLTVGRKNILISTLNLNSVQTQYLGWAYNWASRFLG